MVEHVKRLKTLQVCLMHMCNIICTDICLACF